VFSDPKKGIKGEMMSHSSSGDELLCLYKAIAHRARYLVHQKQPPSTALCRFFQDSVTKHVTPRNIRTALPPKSLNNCQTIAKRKDDYPKLPIPQLLSYHGPLGDVGGKPETHSRNRGCAAVVLVESPIFLNK
jgi:hypothetical protein